MIIKDIVKKEIFSSIFCFGNEIKSIAEQGKLLVDEIKRNSGEYNSAIDKRIEKCML